MEEKTRISLELLLLNDLLRTNTIDQKIYDLAAHKIMKQTDNNIQPITNSSTLATAS